MKYLLLCILILCLFKHKGIGQDAISGNSEHCDSITRSQLFLKVITYTGYVSSKEKLQDFQYADMIRVYNTIHSVDTARTSEQTCLFEYYKKMFRQRFLSSDNLTELDVRIATGTTYYSLKYDLHIGVPYIIRCKDIYAIINL